MRCGAGFRISPTYLFENDLQRPSVHGSALAKSLRADGHRVVRFSRGGVTGVDTIGWDPTTGRIDAPALEGVDAVVHLAGEGIGEHRWTDEQKQKIRESRVRGTATIAGAIASRERKPRDSQMAR